MSTPKHPPGTRLDLERGALDATSSPPKTFLELNGATEKLRLLEYLSGVRLPTNRLLRLANAAVSFCGTLLQFTWAVYCLTVFRDEVEEQIRSYPLYVAFVVLSAVAWVFGIVAMRTTPKRAFRGPSKKRLESTEEDAAQGLLRTAQLHELDVGSLSLGKLPFSMAKSEPLNTIVQNGKRWPTTDADARRACTRRRFRFRREFKVLKTHVQPRRPPVVDFTHPRPDRDPPHTSYRLC